ncbi:MAG: ABC transporter ATP-binding protein [Chloroflexota bacterium]
MLRLEGVAYRYAGAQAESIRGIDLGIDEGEVVGLVGASESGKSTVCLVAAGLAPRTIRGTLTGHLTLDGESVDGWPMHQLAGVVGTLFQDPAAQMSGVCGSVFEEVAFTPMNLGLPRDEVLQRTWAALDDLRIADLAQREPARLSGGQMQLVAIAGLLAMRPRYLVLDEPTAQLDPAGTRLVGEAVARLAAGGASILIAEQKADLLAEVCDRVVVMDGGRILRAGPATTVLGDPGLADLGIVPPAPVMLRRAVTDAGLDPGIVDEAFA